MHIASRIVYLPYRVMRRFVIVNVCCIFAAELNDLRSTRLPEGMVFSEFSSSTLDDLCNAYPDHFGVEQRNFLKGDQARGFAIFEGESLVSYLWMAIENIPGEMNHDGPPATRMPLYLPDGMGYIFNVFVVADYRGRGLYGAMISELTNQLASQGFTGLVLTTEGSNYRALRSVRRMGFRMVGRSLLFGVGGFALAKYPPQPMAGGIRMGRFVGHTRT